MKFVSRSQWGARARGATVQSHPIGSTLGITFHWEGPHMGAFPHGVCDAKVRGIEAYHRDKKKWADIAYNALVCPHGHVFEGRGVGVRSAANGTTRDNDEWYAVCYLGGERDPFTDAAKQGFEDAVRWLREKGDAGSQVNGHRDHKATACPGDEIHRWAHTHQFGRDDPLPPKPLNRVEQAQRLCGEALKIQAEANQLLREVKDRPHVAKMLAKWTAGWHIIADAKADGPPR